MAFDNSSRHIEELNLTGGILSIDGGAKGFIIGSPLNRETVCVHFQHAEPGFPGIYQTILNEACKTSFAGYKYINLEDDAGSEGLRKAKLSYYPIKLEEKFRIEKI